MTSLVTIILIDYILLIRVLAFYHQKKKLSIVLRILLGLEACIRLVILIYGSLLEEPAMASIAEGMTVCVSKRLPSRMLSIVSWVIPMTYGMILLCLVLYKAANYWKLSSGFKGFDLVRVLIRDQVLYFGFVILCSVSKILSVIIAKISPFASDVLNAAGSPTLLCILGGQLLTNLKEAGERGVNGGTNYTPRSVSAIVFGEVRRLPSLRIF
ncbi:hypothetical protein A7U60_g9139 [Sanghuangporus baumii]|uniref:Uncharacterized protein n=1 Tax=Sanghuangporus baumii TaxID=108892 RepID=A0A9Q5HQ74_SANBA|nr:hypothetical protein A7U60_g9139 [Sanghuangporus baumii]